MPDITTIYKNKGSRKDLENDRGVLKLSCVRTILDKLIYLDKYDHIDRNMSDSNVGARKGRNVRNHLFIVNGILNSVKQKEISNIDVQIYDLKQAFDSLWIHDVMNDLYEVCEPDDKISLLFETNKESLLAISTPMGLTERKSVKLAEMQGSVWAPLKCAVTMDVLGKESEQIEENQKKIY